MLTTVLRLLDGDREVQAQAADEGERVSGVDGQWSQDGENLLGEVGRQPVTFGLIQVGLPSHFPRDVRPGG